MFQRHRYRTALITALLLFLLLALPACKKSTAPQRESATASSGSSTSAIESQPEPPWPVEERASSASSALAQSEPDSSSDASELDGEDERPQAADPDFPYIEADGYTVILSLLHTHFSEEEINAEGFQAQYTLFNTSSQNIKIAQSYQIEFYEDGNWIPFPFDLANPPAWEEDAASSLAAGSEIGGSFDDWNTHAPLEYGNYRIVQTVTAGERTFTIYAPFRVQ